MAEQSEERNELHEKVIKISRVAKVVKGGRRFSFSALVVVGTGRGRVGFGMGKANEVTEAIRKGVDIATKNMKPVSIEGRTVAHRVDARFGASRVVMKPCPPGSGIIASDTARAIMEACGIQDVSLKSLGSNNPHNLIKATLNALYALRTYESIAARRGVPVEKLRNPLTA